MLQNEGATVCAYDPVAMPNAAQVNPELTLAENAYEVAKDADAVVICTEWNEFRHLDLSRFKDTMTQPILIDGRNIYEPERMAELGFQYRAVGR